MQITLSQIFGYLSLLATLLTTAAAALNVVRPSWAVYCLAASAAISAFTAKVQGAPERKQ
ncbi:MAG: hypothetical protein M3209_00400 [Acidobacteriota bacterium]|nr:hypothetical protein [Acidobacteriota bacterium]